MTYINKVIKWCYTVSFNAKVTSVACEFLVRGQSHFGAAWASYISHDTSWYMIFSSGFISCLCFGCWVEFLRLHSNILMTTLWQNQGYFLRFVKAPLRSSTPHGQWSMFKVCSVFGVLFCCFFLLENTTMDKASPISKWVVVTEQVYIEPCEQHLWDEEREILPLLEVTLWVFVPLLDLRFSTGERWHTPATVYPPEQVIHTGLSIEPAPEEYSRHYIRCVGGT